MLYEAPPHLCFRTYYHGPIPYCLLLITVKLIVAPYTAVYKTYFPESHELHTHIGQYNNYWQTIYLRAKNLQGEKTYGSGMHFYCISILWV